MRVSWQLLASLLAVCCVTLLPTVLGKTVHGVVSTDLAKLHKGQYISGFYFQGENAELQYKVNISAKGGATFYFFLDEDWQEAKESENCDKKLQLARIVHEIHNDTGTQSVLHFVRPRLWHVLYADSYTCASGRPISPLEKPIYMLYDMRFMNPDTLGNPTEHFGADESGLFRFYQLLVVALFIVVCIQTPQIWEALHKGGPMHLVLQLLSAATGLQFIGAIFMMLHLRGYSKDGEGSRILELLSELLDVASQFVMLYMLLSLAMGWSLRSGHRSSQWSAFHKLREKPAAKVIGMVGVLQSVIFLWEQYEEHQMLEHRMYHAHRSAAGISLAIVRIFLAAIFASNLRATLASERSALKRDFYNSFTKSCMVWFLCYPVLVGLSLFVSLHLRFKLVTLGVVLCQSASILALFRLFLSRSLYWEVSALSSYLPLRMDKTFGRKMYS